MFKEGDRRGVEDAYGPSLKEYGSVLVRGRWIILVSLMLVLGAAAAYSFLVPPTYESTGKMLIQSNSSFPGDLSELLSLASPLGGSNNDVTNRLEIIKSEPVLQDTIRLLHDNPAYVALKRQQASRPGPFERVAFALSQGGGADDALTFDIEDLKHAVSAYLIHDTDIIGVKAHGRSPQEAALIADALIEAYRKQDIAFAKTTVSVIKDFLKDQVGVTQARLEDSEQAVADFQQRSGLDLGVEGVTKKLLQLQALLVEALVELEDKKDERDAIDKFLETVRADILDAQTSRDNTPVILEINDKITLIQKLQKEIRELEVERVRFLEERNYPKVKDLEIQIVQLRRDQEAAASKQFTALDQLPQYERLIQRQLEVSLAIEALQNRVEVIQGEFDAESTKLSQNGLDLLQLQRNLEVDKEIYIQLRTQYESARVVEAGEVGSVQVVQWGDEPEDPIKPKKGMNLLLAALVGVTLGAGITVVRAYLDNTYKSPQDLEHDLGISVLGAVSLEDGAKAEDRIEGLRQQLLLDFDPMDPMVNTYVSIEASLKFSTLDRPCRAIMVASSLPGEGKSTTITNLALVYAHIGKRVLLVDSDMRKPVISTVFFNTPHAGLIEAALGEKPLEDVLVPALNDQTLALNLDHTLVQKGFLKKHQAERLRQQSVKHKQPLGKLAVERGLISSGALAQVLEPRNRALGNLFVLPAGVLPPNVTDFLGSSYLEKLVAVLKDRFDVILFDSPPVSAVPDAAVLSTLLDGVIFVVESNRTPHDVAQHAVAQLHKAGATLLGAVLNKWELKDRKYYGHYGHYGHYGYGTDKDTAA